MKTQQATSSDKLQLSSRFSFMNGTNQSISGDS